GVDVGSGDVGVWSDQVAQVGDVATGDLAQVRLGKLARVAADTPLGAAEGDVDDGALPGHPGGQGPDLIQGDVGVIADAPLARSAHVAVQDAIADEVAHGAVGQLHREFDDDGTDGPLEEFDQAALELGQVGGSSVELLGSDVEGVQVLGLVGRK